MPELQYGSLREKIAADTKARKERYAEFEKLYDKAREAGLAAGTSATPRPMVVTEANGLSNEPKPGAARYFVSEGVCGFAWIKVRPATSSFGRWLQKTGKVRGRAYHGGLEIWVSDFGQSHERKMAYASAFAKVLNEGGITAYADGRLD